MAASEAPTPSSERTPLEEFMALVAHEVRTPLTVVKGAADSLERLDPDTHAAERAEMIAMIGRNVDLAILLMDRMGLARDVEAGNVQLHTEDVDLARLVNETLGDLRYGVVGEHRVTLTGVDTLVVEADPLAVREIVFNVLSNAAKYSAPSAAIEVTLERQEASARMVVRNHGSGVTPGDTDRIFEKYFQSDPGDTELSGVGLGLFISRGLARAHGGDLSIRPATDEGSEFMLDLPLGTSA